MTDTFIHHGKSVPPEKQCHAPLKKCLFIYFLFRGAGSLLLGVGFLCSLGYSFWQNRGSRFEGFSSCNTGSIVATTGSRAQAQEMWCVLSCSTVWGNLPGPGIKPTSHALAGRFLAPLRHQEGPTSAWSSTLKSNCGHAVYLTFILLAGSSAL